MPFTETRYEHIVLDASGVPLISGTTMKVIELVMDRQAYGWSPEELHFQHPGLSMGKIFSALAWYADHQAELDAEIRRSLDDFISARKSAGPAPAAAKWNAGKRPT
ncbi:MAG: DUF433 domain-containing protein [Planctomycetes bacterium]|nr:DUF433 domain-containing protein [Planctomycetota bacterium]